MNRSEQERTRVVRAWLDEGSTQLSPRVHEAVLREVPRLTQDGAFGSWRTRMAAFAVAAAVIVGVAALIGYGLVLAPNVGGPGPQNDALAPEGLGPAGNGLVAYAYDGEVYVGDPVSGETTAIVTGATIDSSPKFSPDGTRIAFIRGNPYTAEASIIVVRPDGSDERVVMPAGFSERGVSFAWTPDSASVVVNHDSLPFTTPYFDGELTLFDASGVAEPTLLTPPLTMGVGGDYFPNAAQVASMFKPPNADLILSGPGPIPERSRNIYVWDADLERHTVLAPEVPGGEDFEPYMVGGASWSPDGSTIMFYAAGDPNGVTPIDGIYLMDADGSDVRRLQLPLTSQEVRWSPDGTKIADQRCSADPDRPGAVIVIVDMSSGAERELEATAVQTKTEGQVPAPAESLNSYCGTYGGPEGRSWDYEGWSWSPDGHSIVMLERSGTRPRVVDVETGEATELPWESDSAVSWQRSAAD